MAGDASARERERLLDKLTLLSSEVTLEILMAKDGFERRVLSKLREAIQLAEEEL